MALVLLGGLFTFTRSSDFMTTNVGPTHPCEQPLTYKFGEIDSRFNLDIKELTDVMKEVEALWATALGKELLEYDENGKIVVHLVYSEDQKRTVEERAFSERIEVKKGQIKVAEQEYKRLSNRFLKEREELQETADEYNREIKKYNDYAEKWGEGNIPAHARNRFKRMERTIKRLKSDIDRKQKNLESLRKQTNSKSQLLNRLVDEQNEMISEYNSRFSGAKKFDQGRYIKQGGREKINIFQFANLAQLKTVLAHEAGHAMGLGHVDNPESVMHEMMGKQNIFNLELTDEDISAIKNRCRD